MICRATQEINCNILFLIVLLSVYHTLISNTPVTPVHKTMILLFFTVYEGRLVSSYVKAKPSATANKKKTNQSLALENDHNIIYF